jgi:heat shock protein HtpX
MFFIIINCLFNGLLLSIIYFIAVGHIIQAQLGQMPPWIERWIYLALGIGTTVLLMLFGISRFGHFLLRLFLGARKLTHSERLKIDSILSDILENTNNHLGTNFKSSKLYMLVKDYKDINVQAIGSDTIVVTDGLLRIATDDELHSVLANAVGHLYYKDSVTLVALVYSSFATWLISFTDKVASWSSPVGNISKILLALILIIKLLLLPFILLRWLGISLLNISLLFMGRQYEYRADKFAKDLGYQDGLISFLEKIQAVTEYDNSIMGRIFATYPAPMKRIGRLED